MAREAAKTAAVLDDRLDLALSFALLASVAAARHEPAVAGRFWGTLEALEREREWLDPESRATYSSRVEPARGPEFASAAEAVRQLAPDDAVSTALAEID